MLAIGDLTVTAKMFCFFMCLFSVFPFFFSLSLFSFAISCLHGDMVGNFDVCCVLQRLLANDEETSRSILDEIKFLVLSIILCCTMRISIIK